MLFLIVDSFFKVFLGPLYGFTDRSDEELTGNRMRERGSDMQPRDPGRESNPSLLQRGHSLST